MASGGASIDVSDVDINIPTTRPSAVQAWLEAIDAAIAALTARVDALEEHNKPKATFRTGCDGNGQPTTWKY